jgi:multidrug transporter EmrE-like cation transporter
MANLLVILLSVILNAVAQIFLKMGTATLVFPEKWNFGSSIATILDVATNLFIMLGLLCYGTSVVVWIYVLSNNEVSYAYPFLSIGFVLVAILGWLIFDDNLSVLRIVGIAFVCTGVALVSRT